MARSRLRDESEHLNVFPAFTDLMSNAFMILSLFLLLALVQSQRLNYELQKANEKLRSADPILIDEKAGNFSFQPKSAEISQDLDIYINQTIIPSIEKTLKNHEIDFIQVIGHTDGQEINSSGNLDQNLEKVAIGKKQTNSLNPGSNADLGLMRALAVVKKIESTGKFKNVKFRAYSAAQLYLPSGKLASPLDRGDKEERRRIEIRFIPPGKKQDDL